MTVNFYMFGLFMKSSIGGQMNCSLVVTKNHTCRSMNTKRLTDPSKWIVAWLSQKTIQVIFSLATDARVLYLALAEDLETVGCFLDFQKTKESPMKSQCPVVDLLVSGHCPQSASAYALSLRSEEAENSRPCLGAALIYQSKWWRATKWGARGEDMSWLNLATGKSNVWPWDC